MNFCGFLPKVYLAVVLEKIVALGLEVLANTSIEIIDERKQQGRKRGFMKEGALGDIITTIQVEVHSPMPANKKCIPPVYNLGPELQVRRGKMHLDLDSIH